MNSSARQGLWNTLVLLMLLLSQCAYAAGNTIVIGQAIDLSSPNGSIGRDYVAGIKTYFDSINANGGINGKHIQYIVRDDQGQPELAVGITNELIARDKADFLFGGVGDDVTDAILESPAFKRSGQILYAPLTGAIRPKETHVLFWRPNYRQEIQYIFSYFVKVGIKDIGVAYQDSPANQDAYRSLLTEIQGQRMKLTGTAHIAGDGNQIAGEAGRLSQSKPGFVVVIADTIATGLFLKEFRKSNPQTFVAGTSLINLATLRELAGVQAVRWTVFSQVVPNPNSGASMIQAEHLNMMKKYRDEAVSSLTLEGFAAAKALAKMIQQSKHANHLALQEMPTLNANIDLGGISIVCSPSTNRLSTYLDIALFTKGNDLMF
jgi:ABC-type branched-subunit amino acid transport system substrate-binding protein